MASVLPAITLALLSLTAHAAIPTTNAGAGQSVESNGVVFLADKSSTTIRAFSAEANSELWTRTFPAALDVDLGVDPEGGIIVAGSNTVLFSDWLFYFNRVRASDGQDAGAAPTVDFSNQPASGVGSSRNFRGFQVVDGQIAGFFRRPTFREAATITLPAFELMSYRTSAFIASTYLGEGYQFLVEIDQSSSSDTPPRGLVIYDTSKQGWPVFADGESRLVRQEQPDRRVYNALCGVRLASRGGEIVLSAVASKARSTPDGAGTFFCPPPAEVEDFDTLIVQSIDPATLTASWTKEIAGSYKAAATAVDVRDGVVAAAVGNSAGEVEVVKLDIATGHVQSTLKTSGGGDTIQDVYVLQSGDIATTGTFNSAEGSRPIVFFDEDGPIDGRC